jgi:hypothetical protein
MFQEDLTIDEVLADPLILQVMRADGITAYQLRGLLEEVRDRTCKSEPSKLRTRDSDRVRESWQLDTVGRPRKCIATKHNLKRHSAIRPWSIVVP